MGISCTNLLHDIYLHYQSALLFAFAATMLMVNIKISVFGNHHVFVAEVNEIN